MFDTISTTESSIYIVELASPHERQMIQFVPDKMSYPRNAEGSTFSIVGRNHPKFHYSHGTEVLKMQLEFYSDDVGRRDVMNAINWLKSLTMNDGYAGKIRNVKIIMGKMFLDEVFVVKSVNPEMSHFEHESDWLPIRATVDMEFMLDPNRNWKIKDRRKRL